MNKNFIWTVKAANGKKSLRFYEELKSSEDLFDENGLEKYKTYDIISRSFEKAYNAGCEIVTFIDECYPKSLKRLTNPPPVLYVRGNVKALTHPLYCGVVGARKSDDYGIRMARNLAREISETGIGIVTGGAEGVDGAANKGALDARGKTIAVLGSGIDVLYPKCNTKLFNEILEKDGAIISEFHCGTPPEGRNFPVRNRIIAAMGESILVVRAGLRSGSLITAHMALDMGKTVFSVPGNIDNHLSMGTNALLTDGAVPLVSSMDIIDDLMNHKPDFFTQRDEEITEIERKPEPIIFNKEKPKKKSGAFLSEFEEEIVSAIENGFQTQIEIEEKVSFDAARLTAMLGMLELKGVIKKGMNNKYKITTGG
ncbi:MAG: DNA-processing protein DprA [Clostridia bacterium]|nr:DNA-processing protein DprA [Clostridia bacterium]